MDKERAEHIVYLANQRLAPSALALRHGEDAASSRCSCNPSCLLPVSLNLPEVRGGVDAPLEHLV